MTPDLVLIVAVLSALVGGTVAAWRAAVRTAVATRTRRRAVRALSAGSGGSRLAVGPRPPAWVEQRLVAAACPWPSDQAWAVWLAGTGGCAAASMIVGGPAMALLVAALAAGVPAGCLWLRRDARQRGVERAMPDALEAVARALRSGASLRSALGEAGVRVAHPDLAADLGGVALASEHGVPVLAALDAWALARPLPGVRLAVAALSLGAEAGGVQAQAMDGVAATLRDRLALGRELDALAAQARISALVIGIAPLGFAAVAMATDSRTATFLLRTPIGLGCLGGGLLLDAIAAVWMARLTEVEP